jgi:O-antigen ligase
VLALTASRSAYTGAAAALAVLLILRLGRDAIAVAGALVAATLVLGLGLGFGRGGTISSTGIQGAPAPAISTLESWYERTELWFRALYTLHDFPFTLIGLNTFPVVLNATYPLLESSDPFVPNAHNLLLQTGVDFGLPGFLAFLWTLGLPGAAGCVRGREPAAAPRLGGTNENLGLLSLACSLSGRHWPGCWPASWATRCSV